MSTFLVGESLMRQADVAAATRALLARGKTVARRGALNAWRANLPKAKSSKTTGSALTHIDAKGEARMVDVSAKPATERVAVAEGRVVMSKATLDLIVSGQRQKGRRAGHRARRRHHGGQAHRGPDPAVPSAGAVESHARHRPTTSCRAASSAPPSRSPARPVSRWKR
jgi:hypothetical protein